MAVLTTLLCALPDEVLQRGIHAELDNTNQVVAR
jgi:hypothetical protein